MVRRKVKGNGSTGYRRFSANNGRDDSQTMLHLSGDYLLRKRTAKKPVLSDLRCRVDVSVSDPKSGVAVIRTGEFDLKDDSGAPIARGRKDSGIVARLERWADKVIAEKKKQIGDLLG